MYGKSPLWEWIYGITWKHTILAFIRGGSRAAATSKMERFVIMVNGWKLSAVNYYHKALHLGCFQPLTFITKCYILDVAAVLDPPLTLFVEYLSLSFCMWTWREKKNPMKLHKQLSKCVLKKAILKICSKFTEEHACRSLSIKPQHYLILMPILYFSMTLQFGIHVLNWPIQ